MTQYKTHVCLVSKQAAPNLLPMLDDNLKPDKVILLVTPQMTNQASWLTDVIKPRGIAVESIKLESTESFDRIQEELLNILSNYEGTPESIALNATGGTKWMAIAAQEVFRSFDSPVFYVDVDTDNVLFIDKKEPHKLNQKIDIENYLKTYGYKIIKEEKENSLSLEHKELCEQMVVHVDEWQSAIGYLNYLASEAEHNKTLQHPINNQTALPIYFDKLIEQCYHAKLIKSASLKEIVFNDENARQFCNGGWLESYTNRLLNELRSEKLLQDKPHLNLTVQSNNSKNEVDVAFMAKNRLHIIECKTKRLKDKHAGQAGTETVYKLDSISELGGLGTKAMIVSYRPLNKADKQRAKDLGIKVVTVKEIQNLKSTLKEWINGS